MKFAKSVFKAAGIYGLIVRSPMYFMDEKINRKLQPAITDPEYFYGFLGGAVAWQIVILAPNSLRYP